jgi:hypothetical protein
MKVCSFFCRRGRQVDDRTSSSCVHRVARLSLPLVARIRRGAASGDACRRTPPPHPAARWLDLHPGAGEWEARDVAGRHQRCAHNFTLRTVPTLNTDSRITVNLAKGSVSASRLPVGFVIGDPDLPQRHCSFHQNAIVGNFKFLDADGLIGQDVLARFQSITFDFKNSILILQDR